MLVVVWVLECRRVGSNVVVDVVVWVYKCGCIGVRKCRCRL